MNKLPKEKRDKVIMVWLLVLMTVAAWIFVVLNWQLDVKHVARTVLEQRRLQHEEMTRALTQKDEIAQKADEAGSALVALESKMVSGDTFSWINTTLREFKQGRDVDLPQISQPNESENTLLPKFPYRQATVKVAGTGFYHDIGMFIADFENKFPFARIINLDIEHGNSLNATARDREKLSFSMDIIFLVKPNKS